MTINNNTHSKNKKVGLETKEILKKTKDSSIFNNTPVKITGPPRNRKTTTAQKLAFSIGITESRPVIVASRTKNNARANYETFRKHISPVNPAILYFGTSEICPSTSEDDHYAKHMITCNGSKELELDIIQMKDYLDWVDYQWQKAYQQGYCPKAVQKQLLQQLTGHYTIFTTYSSLSEVIENSDTDLNEAVIILDEYRHTNQLPIRETHTIDAEGNSAQETFLNWQKDLQNLDYEILPVKYREQVEKLVNKLLAQLSLRFNVAKQYKHFNKEYVKHLASGTEPFNASVPDQIYPILANKIEKTEASKLLETLNLIDALSEDDSRAEFDILKDADDNFQALELIIRQIQGNKEHREEIRKLVETPRKTFIVDSTPFPESFDKFFFGKNIDYDTITLPASYDSTIVSIDTSYSLTAVRKQGTNCGMVELISQIIEDIDQQIAIFCRSKDEKAILKRAGIPTENLFHMRGVEQEGVSLDDFDYIITTGPPLQNPSSELYRRLEVSEVIEKSRYNINDRNIQLYYKWKAYMEMLQSAFRTKKGVIMLNVSKNDKYRMKNCWNWLDEFDWQSPSIQHKHIEVKSEVVEEKLLSENPRTSQEIRNEWIENQIEKLFQIKPYYAKTELVEKIPVKDSVVAEVRNQMKYDGKLNYIPEGRTCYVEKI